MGRVDEEIETFLGENARETVSAAKASAEQPAGKLRGLRSSPGERKGDVKTRVACKCAGEVSSLAAAAENEKLHWFHHAEVAL
jgi:hypothetical protein